MANPPNAIARLALCRGQNYQSNMENIVLLPLKAKHFQDTNFMSICNCAIAKAAKDYFNCTYANEGVNNVSVELEGKIVYYNHEVYNDKDFLEDQTNSYFSNHEDDIIRTIELKLNNVIINK